MPFKALQCNFVTLSFGTDVRSVQKDNSCLMPIKWTHRLLNLAFHQDPVLIAFAHNTWHLIRSTYFCFISNFNCSDTGESYFEEASDRIIRNQTYSLIQNICEVWLQSKSFCSCRSEWTCYLNLRYLKKCKYCN